MATLNKCLFIVNLGSDPEVRTIAGGSSVCSVSGASTERYKDKQGNQKEKTEWIKFNFWDQKAILVAQYCKKGSSLFIEGKYQTRDWEDKDGNKRKSTEILVMNMQFLDSKEHSQNYAGGQPQSAPAPQAPSAHAGNDDFIEEDVPF